MITASSGWQNCIGRPGRRSRCPASRTAGCRRFAAHDAFAPSESAWFANPIRTGTEQLLATLATHSWALVSEPGERDAAFAQIRAYLAERPETSSGDFVLPMTTDVLRALRR